MAGSASHTLEWEKKEKITHLVSHTDSMTAVSSKHTDSCWYSSTIGEKETRQRGSRWRTDWLTSAEFRFVSEFETIENTKRKTSYDGGEIKGRK